ncbi:MAG TPA: hypothetical protein VGO52_18890 [Hyphomonadaceae bacterium]|nr:hypothetical protein [Hyphomonadaceae bacterium]
MTQFLVLAGQRAPTLNSKLGLRFQPVGQEAVASYARGALKLAASAPVFEPVEDGQTLEVDFDANFDIQQLDQLVDDCADNFRCIVFSYGLEGDLETATDVPSLKAILHSQSAFPAEFNASWCEASRI